MRNAECRQCKLATTCKTVCTWGVWLDPARGGTSVNVGAGWFIGWGSQYKKDAMKAFNEAKITYDVCKVLLVKITTTKEVIK